MSAKLLHFVAVTLVIGSAVMLTVQYVAAHVIVAAHIEGIHLQSVTNTNTK